MYLKVTGTLLICAMVIAGAVAAAFTTKGPVLQKGPVLHTTRQFDSDLEITGMVRGLDGGASAYLRRSDLLALPQTRAVISDDGNLRGTLHVSGVSLEVLARAVGALPDSDLIDALCEDKYRSHFPSGYIAQHHPILVLTIDGKTLASFAAESQQFDPSPYMVMYPQFVPAFRVLAHPDEPQIPDRLVRVNFTTQAQTFDAIAPRSSFPAESPQQQGFIIAKQNCLRCHFQGQAGGTKSGRTWQSLGVWAREQPVFFQAYVKNPQKFEPHTHMAPNPGYDAATLAALTAYFKTFAETR